MNLNYKERVKLALISCKTVDEVSEIEERIPVTDKINRRTKSGRELTEELLTLCNKRKRELVEQGDLPF